MAKIACRRMFGLAVATSLAALPAVAAPMVEMHEADVTPLITIRRPMRDQTDSWTYSNATIRAGDQVSAYGMTWTIIAEAAADGR